MNGSDTAETVVNEQINRMVEQEKARFKLTLTDGLGCLPPSYTKDEILDLPLRMAVLTKISMTAGMN